MNQTLKQRLFEIDGSGTWDQRLPRITHAINCSSNTVTGFSPFELESGLRGQNLADQIQYTRSNAKDPEVLRKIALERILSEKEKRVEKYDEPNFEPFKIGDLVLAKNHRQKVPRFIGPYEVSRVRGDGLSYEIKELDGFTAQIRAVEELKPYTLRNNLVQDDQEAFQKRF